MTTLEGFRPAGEVVADERSRVAISKAGAHRDDRYAISVNDDGVIMLVPVVSIPRRELILHENGELRASVLHGLAEAAEGRARPLGWLSNQAE